jgi:ankyrin repeat protein
LGIDRNPSHIGTYLRRATNDKNRYTPLHLACLHGHLYIAALLIDKKANIHEETALGLTPFALAVLHGHRDIAKFLIDNKAKTHQQQLMAKHYCIWLFC